VLNQPLTNARQPYEGLVGAAEGRGPPVTLLVADTLVVVMLAVVVGLVTEPCDTVPMGASETVDDDSIEEGMSAPS
jgi:hypothetical protein